jgi:hypothetical protein
VREEAKLMTRASQVTLTGAALLAVAAITSMALNAQGRRNTILPPSVVQSSALPSCPADGGPLAFFGGGGGGGGSRRMAGMYGQVFLSGGGGRSARLNSEPASRWRNSQGNGNGSGSGAPNWSGPGNGRDEDGNGRENRRRNDRRRGDDDDDDDDEVPLPAEPDPAPPAVTPEPGTWLLIGTGVAGLLATRRRARRGTRD